MGENRYDYNIVNKNFNDNKKLRVAVYTRVSTNDQYINWVWIDAQFSAIKKELNLNKDKYTFSKKKNYYEDWWKSWADEHRPELDRMIRDIDNWEIDIIIVYKIDRLFRKLLYLLQFIDSISLKWVFLKSINDKIDTSDKMWMFMLQFMWIIWDIERDNIRIRTIDWKKAKASKWYYVWWWKTPFWYDLHNTPWWKKLVINHNEAKVVNKIFNLYVNKNYTLWDIAKTLTMEGVPTRDDRLKLEVEKDNLNKENHNKKYNENQVSLKKWTKKENDGKWYSSSIRKILRKEIYIWKYYYWITTKIWDKEKQKFIIVENEKENLIEFKSPTILKDISLYNEAQKILDKNIVKKTKSPYLFSWLIKCWVCWYSYNWYKSSKWTLHYRCKWWTTSSNLKVKCKNSEVSEDILFKYCWWELERNLSNPDNFKKVVFNEEKNKEIISNINKRITEISSLLKSKRNTLENAIINELEATNNLKKQIYSKKITEYEKEISKLEIEDKELRREISIIKSNEKKKDDIKKFNMEHQKAIESLTNDRKKELIKKYINTITKNLWKLRIRFNILDEFNWKDWREGWKWDNKKLKSHFDLFDVNTININDIIKNMWKRRR